MMSVKEVANEFHVTPETIRNWDRRGILIADLVTPTGHRFYSEHRVKLLLDSGISAVAKYRRQH